MSHSEIRNTKTANLSADSIQAVDDDTVEPSRCDPNEDNNSASNSDSYSESNLSENETSNTEELEKGDGDEHKKHEEYDATIAPAFDEVNSNNDELAELRGEGRYFGVTDPELNEPICSNCHRRGHRRNKCKVVVCHACGKVDDHYETQCPNSMVCSNCGKRGHFRNQCTEKRKFNYCTFCDSRNHSSDRCPNIWRSYIVKNINSKIAYPSGSVFCYNCAKQGHYGDECPSGRISKTPNINGSAFTGDNLPKELRGQYQTQISRLYSELDSYGFSHSNQATDIYDRYNNHNDNSKKRGRDENDGPRSYKKQKSINYSNVPPPKKSGVLSAGPSKSGFLPLKNNNKRNNINANPKPYPSNQGYLPKNNTNNNNNYRGGDNFNNQGGWNGRNDRADSYRPNGRSGYIDNRKDRYNGNRGTNSYYKSSGGSRYGGNNYRRN